jgi:hypothetical protein
MKKIEIPKAPKELIKYFVRRVAAIGDMHLMSEYSMFPEKFVTIQEATITPKHPEQTEIWKSYQHFLSVCDFWDIDMVLLTSDLMHGQNPYERGSGLMSTNMNEQIELVEYAARPLVKDRISHWVSGSGYHNSVRGMAVEKEVCDRLCKEGVSETTWHGPIANLRIKPFGKVINLTHGGGAAAYYRETLEAREIIYGKAAAIDKKLEKIDIYVRGHFHWFNHLHQSNTHYVQIPCWTAYEPVPMWTKNYVRYQPDIGAALLMFDQEGRLTVWPFLYPLPHIVDKMTES